MHQQQPSSPDVSYSCRVHLYLQQQPLGVHYNMALDTLDLFTSVITRVAAAAHQRTLHRLGINDGSTGLWFSFALLPDRSDQPDSDLFNHSCHCPLFEVVVYTLPFRE